MRKKSGTESWKLTYIANMSDTSVLTMMTLKMSFSHQSSMYNPLVTLYCMYFSCIHCVKLRRLRIPSVPNFLFPKVSPEGVLIQDMLNNADILAAQP